MESKLLACLQRPPTFAHFNGEVKSCLRHAGKLPVGIESLSSLVLLGWYFDSESSGAPVRFDDLERGRFPFESVRSTACYLWLEVTIRGNGTTRNPTPLKLDINDRTIEEWHGTARACFTDVSRAREIGSLATCSPVSLFTRSPTDVGAFNIYSWEGVKAPLLVKAGALQAAMRLERTMSDVTRSGIRLYSLLQHWGLKLFTVAQRTPNGALLNELKRSNYLYLRLIAHALDVDPQLIQAMPVGRAPHQTLPALTPCNPGADFVRCVRSEENQLPTKPQIARLLLPQTNFEESIADGDSSNVLVPSRIRSGLSQVPVLSFGQSQSAVPHAPDPKAAPNRDASRVRHQPVLPVPPTRSQHKSSKRTEPESGGEDPGQPYCTPAALHPMNEDSHRSGTTENEDSVESQRSSKARRVSIRFLPNQDNNTFAGVQVPALDAVRPVKGPQSPSTPPHVPAMYYHKPAEVNSQSSVSSQSSSNASSTPQTSLRADVPALPRQIRLPANKGMGVPPIAALSSVRRQPLPHEPQSANGNPDEERGALLARFRNEISPVIPNKLYVGGEAVAADLSILRRTAISHILNAAGDTCPNFFPGMFDYLTLVLQDSRLTNEALESVLPATLSFVDQSLKKNGVVLIHCREGVSRSATIAVAYLMWREGLNFPSALDRVRNVRPVCNPNTGFTFTLLKFGKRVARLLNPTADAPTPFERKLCRVTTHHPSAPFIVVLGISLFEPQRGAWMPGGEALILDPRFYYVLRDDYTIHVWSGAEVPRHMSKVLNKSIDKFIRDIMNVESLPDNGLKIMRYEQGSEDPSFWETLYCNRKPENPIRRLPHLDDEARILQAALPQLTVFDISVWEAQLKARPEADTVLFAFRPPEGSQDTSSRDTRLLHRTAPPLQSPAQQTPSARHLTHMSDRHAEVLHVRARPGTLREPAPSTGRIRLSYGRDKFGALSEETVQAPTARGASPSIAAVQSETDLAEPKTDLVTESLLRMNNAAESQAMLGTPPELTSRSDAGVMQGVGANKAFDIGVPYFFIVPNLIVGEEIVDDDCLDSTKAIIIVKFGPSALLVPSEVSSAEVESSDESEELNSARRHNMRFATAPPKRRPDIPLLAAMRHGGSGPEEGETLESIQTDLQGGPIKPWRTKIWLWEGRKGFLASDEERDTIIDKFREIHRLDHRNCEVVWEVEDKESSEFQALVYLR